MTRSSSPTQYNKLLKDLKTRIQEAQARAVLAVNAELVRLYWEIGRLIDGRQKSEGWGAAVIPRLARELKNELPDVKGFSQRNIDRMIAFYRAYPDPADFSPQPVAKLPSPPISPQPVAKLEASSTSARTVAKLPSPPISPQAVAKLETSSNLPQRVAKSRRNSKGPSPAAQIPDSFLWSIPWAHHVVLMEKIKDVNTRIWYMHQSLACGWSRNVLYLMVTSEAHARQGKPLTNFKELLPSPESDLVQQALKDPYIFDFLTLEEPYHERELEINLLHELEKFLLELGQGFAFVGRQYHMAVGDSDFYIDLLFYHLKLRRFVVIDLKKGAFKPEYAGKMNFYLAVVDDKLRHDADGPSIGLILCQDRNHVVAEYALRGLTQPIGVSEYELTRALPAKLRSLLPTVEEIEAELGDGEKSDVAVRKRRPRGQNAKVARKGSKSSARKRTK